MSDDELPKVILESLGYEVSFRPTSTKKEADFLVKYGSSEALIEAKIKSDDAEKSIKRELELEQGKVSISDATLGRNETISGVIKNASHQLRSSFSNTNDFSIITYIATGINARAKRDQIFDTLYGSTNIIECNKPPSPKKCYFFRHSDFYRRKEYLDAAIIGYVFNDKIDVCICLNPYSERYDSLKKSEFLSPFGKAVIDPVSLEKSGAAYMPDAAADRKSENSVLANLEKKYDIYLCRHFDFNSPEISIRGTQSNP